jgi:hypothetical protein
MHTISDAIVWRSIFMAAVLAVFFAGIAFAWLTLAIRRHRQKRSSPELTQSSRHEGNHPPVARHVSVAWRHS